MWGKYLGVHGNFHTSLRCFTAGVERWGCWGTMGFLMMFLHGYHGHQSDGQSFLSGSSSQRNQWETGSPQV